ncbi:BamA/TamA family outer membrane protein [Leptothoe sp. LEGE 181152]|nr:BamA/TamA family outer membrane protein [Leptothoe sp. LEGE 181152]
MEIKLLSASYLLQQHGWVLLIPLSVTSSSLLLTFPGWAQTNTSLQAEESLVSSQELTELDTSSLMAAQDQEEHLEATPHSAISLKNNDLTVPSSNGEVISDIQVRFVNGDGEPIEGNTKDEIITREFDLHSGDVYDSDLALEGLERVDEMFIIKQASLTLEPAADDQVVMVVTVDERDSFFFSFGNTLPRPTALQGPSRPAVVNASSNSARGFSAGARLGFTNIGGNNQALTLGVEGGENTLGVDVDFRQFLKNGSGYGINFANQRGVEPEFTGGDREVETPSGDEPWVHRLGGGVEYFRPLASDFDAALGISYQRISVREDAFSDDIASEDELGNDLTVSDDGQDDLLTVNFSGVIDRRNSSKNPTKGSRLLVGADQSIPIGDADILFTRLSANYTQFLPLNLFGFTEGPRTLVLNVQGGTILGDTPPYDAFSLGGSSSVRGYSSGEIGTGESFVQATAEYRFPMFSFNAFDDDVDVGGTFFFDYASDLGSGDDVIGEPAEARDKPGDGFGYGLGIRALTSIGAVRLEFGINDEGDSEVIFNIGDRF